MMYLKEFIDITGISVSDLAKRANVSVPTVQKLLDNKNINSDSMKKIFIATKEIAISTKKFSKLPEWLQESSEPEESPPMVRKARNHYLARQGAKSA